MYTLTRGLHKVNFVVKDDQFKITLETLNDFVLARFSYEQAQILRSTKARQIAFRNLETPLQYTEIVKYTYIDFDKELLTFETEKMIYEVPVSESEWQEIREYLESDL